MNNKDQSPKGVLNFIRAFVQKEADRRRRVLPESLSIRVDGIDRAIFKDLGPSFPVVFQEGAMIVEIVGRDEEGEVVIAAYLLTYDGTKTEVWKVTLPWGDEI